MARSVDPAPDPGLPDGHPLRYRQRPQLLRADDPGGLAFDDFLVAGDVETLSLDRSSISAEDHVVAETWTRTGTTAIDGRLVSIFNPAWSHAELWDSIGWRRRGFDQPRVYFGTLKIPRKSAGGDPEEEDAGDEHFVWLNVAPLNVPASRVERIDDALQYASHVVNLVVSGFGDSRLAEGGFDLHNGFDLHKVTQRFYAHFEDAYDSIAVVAADHHLSHEFEAFHQNVRNDIVGLGALATFDNSLFYGSDGVLRSVELYRDGSFTRASLSHHEIGHQWVDYWSWESLSDGVDFGEQGNHTPLLFPGEVFTGGVLRPHRRIARTEDESFVIERTPTPAAVHPMTLYRMGLIGPEELPELLVFEDQNPFENRVPDVGTDVEEAVHPVHVNDILAEHGSRRGPVDDVWRRATVVVSRDGLLSPEEMNFWNFFAARHAATAGVTTFDGVPSYHEATGGRVRLHTEIRPLRGGANHAPLKVSHRPIDPREFRDVRLDEPVPGAISVGEPVTLAGIITTTERDDYYSVCAQWNRDGVAGEDQIYECDYVNGNRFSIPYTFTAEQAGQYMLSFHLFWPDSGPQYGRSYISGITIE